MVRFRNNGFGIIFELSRLLSETEVDEVAILLFLVFVMTVRVFGGSTIKNKLHTNDK